VVAIIVANLHGKSDTRFKPAPFLSRHIARRNELQIAISQTNAIRALGHAIDTACEELNIEIERLDVPTRDRLIARILTGFAGDAGETQAT
jgi:hypothetical protein